MIEIGKRKSSMFLIVEETERLLMVSGKIPPTHYVELKHNRM